MVEALDVVGVLCVEFFLTISGELLINETAPRPHNSGHWTIEGARTSQFEQHLRAVLDLPLGDTSRTSDWAVMGNILGSSQSDMFGHYRHLMERLPTLKFHHYRKGLKDGRKIGHVLLLGWDCDLLDLITDIDYAVDYLNGVANE